MLSRSPATLLQRARTVHRKAGLRALGFSTVRFALPTPGDAYLDLAKRELERGAPRAVPLRERLATYRRGFTTRLYFLYGFDRGNDPSRYLSEVARKAHAEALNDAPELVDDKVRFHEAFAEPGLAAYLPRCYGTIRDGEFDAGDGEFDARDDEFDSDDESGHGTGEFDPGDDPDPGNDEIHPGDGEIHPGDDEADARAAGRRSPTAGRDERGSDGLLAVLRREGAFVLKEARGGGGSGVYVCEWDDGTVRVDGRRRAPGALAALLERTDRGIVTEYCEQAAYLEEIYPGSPNTLRVLVVDPEGAEAFVPIAAQRLGTSRTGGLDNFTRGGLSAEVDVESGELGPGVEYREEGAVASHERHPDTGARIAGAAVPSWDAIRDRLLEITASFPGLRYVGWDVLATGPGEFVLVEGNSYPDPDVLQVHRPLLADPRVRQFYRDNGVPVGA